MWTQEKWFLPFYFFHGNHIEERTTSPFGLGWNSWNAHLHFSFFFFFHTYQANFFTVYLLLQLLFINSSSKVWLFPHFLHKFHCLWTHKFHFSTTFSLKMGPTVLFTHLKTILRTKFSYKIGCSLKLQTHSIK